MKNYLCIFSHAPYSGYHALESLELALAISSFEQSVSLLFVGDGVRQLLVGTQAPAGYKEFTKAYLGLSLFGIEAVYATQASLDAIGDAQLLLQPKAVNEQQLDALIKSHDIVFEC